MRLGIYKVRGDSMSPNFVHDDYVLSFAWCCTRYRKGDVVLVKHPQYRTIIKRIADVNRSIGEVLLVGDNSASTSSESLGWLKYNNLMGKVIWHIAPPRHIGDTN